MLYGTFCEHVLGEDSGHYHEPRIDSLNYWGIEQLDDSHLGELKAQLRPEHVAIMVSAQSHTPVSSIRRALCS